MVGRLFHSGYQLLGLRRTLDFMNWKGKVWMLDRSFIFASRKTMLSCAWKVVRKRGTELAGVELKPGKSKQ